MLVEDDEILMIDNKIVGPFKTGLDTTADIKTPVNVISQAGQSFDIAVARSVMVRRNTEQFYDETTIVQVKWVI